MVYLHPTLMQPAVICTESLQRRTGIATQQRNSAAGLNKTPSFHPIGNSDSFVIFVLMDCDTDMPVTNGWLGGDAAQRRNEFLVGNRNPAPDYRIVFYFHKYKFKELVCYTLYVT